MFLAATFQAVKYVEEGKVSEKGKGGVYNTQFDRGKTKGKQHLEFND